MRGPTKGLHTSTSAGDVREQAIAIVQSVARDMGFIDEDVADIANCDGDDGLAVQAVELALTRTPTPDQSALRAALERIDQLADDALESDTDTPFSSLAMIRREARAALTTLPTHPGGQVTELQTAQPTFNERSDSYKVTGPLSGQEKGAL